MFDYVCVYSFSRDVLEPSVNHVVRYTDDGISAFEKGFWINNMLEFTKGTDRKYWIPPSQIVYVERVKKDGG